MASAGLLAMARGQTTAASAKPAIAAASVRWLCTGRCTGFLPTRFTVDPARASCDGCLTLGLLWSAYGLQSESQIEGAPEWMFWDRYNFHVASTVPVSRTQMNQILLRRVLDQCFALDARLVATAVPGYALVVAPGGIKFHAVAKKPAMGPPRNGIGHLTSPAQIAGEMTQWYYQGKRFGATRPVRDATELHGLYDIQFPVMPQADTNLVAALGSLGLAVKPEAATETRLQILHIDHLRTNCVLGPGGVRPEN